MFGVRDHVSRIDSNLVEVVISAFVRWVDVSPLCLKRAIVTKTEHEIPAGICGLMWVCPQKHHNDDVHTYLQKPSFLDERLQPAAKYRE